MSDPVRPLDCFGQSCSKPVLWYLRTQLLHTIAHRTALAQFSLITTAGPEALAKHCVLAGSMCRPETLHALANGCNTRDGFFNFMMHVL